MIYEGLDEEQIKSYFLEKVVKQPDCKVLRSKVAKVLGDYYFKNMPKNYDYSQHFSNLSKNISSKEELSEQINRELYKPISEDKPMWEMVIGTFKKKFSLVYVRMHHAYGDGLSCLHMHLRYHDNYHGLKQKFIKFPKFHRIMLCLIMLIYIPYKMVVTLLQNTETGGFKSPTPAYETTTAISQHFDVDRTSKIAKHFKVSINDLLTSAMYTSSSRYIHMSAHIRKKHGKNMNIVVPMSLRQPFESSAFEVNNDITLLPMVMPLHISNTFRDSITQLNSIHKSFVEAKHSLFPSAFYLFFRYLNLFIPCAITNRIVMNGQGKSSFLISNMAGPGNELALHQCPLNKIYLFLPAFGRLHISFVCVSYAGKLVMTSFADKNIIPNLGGFMQVFHGVMREYDEHVREKEKFMSDPGEVPVMNHPITQL